MRTRTKALLSLAKNVLFWAKTLLVRAKFIKVLKYILASIINMEIDVRYKDTMINNERSSKTRYNLISEHLMMSLSPRNNHLKMTAGSVYIPKDSAKKPQGEDSHFIYDERQVMGVADGVGGWNKLGIDSGEYARELMTNSLISAYKSQGMVDPASVLSEAYLHTKSEGSSTACVLTLNKNFICAANVGDSGFMIIRDGKEVYRSPIQQRCFNCPYQLGICKDNPSVAQVLKVEAKPGDVVIAGTDGLFDNMDGAEIEEIIAKNFKGGDKDKPEDLACLIANHALYNSFDRYTETPFSRASKKAKRKHSGGKIDDITVIVAFVKQSLN